MKIIDEKGRLFGKINLIDFIVIVFLLSFIPMFYFGYKIISRRNVVIETPLRHIEIELYNKLIKVNREILDIIAVGDKEIDSDGRVIGELTWVGETKAYKYRLDIGAGEPISKEDLELKEIPVRLKIKANARGNSLYYKDKQITLNSPFDFVTSKYSIEAIPIGKNEIEKEIGRIEMEMACAAIKVNREILDIIAVGDKEIDSDGTVIGELTWFGENRPYKYKFDIGTGEPISKEDLELKEVLVRLKIKANVKEGSLYYKDKPITVNSSFDFVTGKYNIEAIPIGKDELKKTKEIGNNVKVMRRVKIDLNLIFNNLTEDIISLIAIGDKGLDEKGEVVAEILDIGRIENNILNIDLGNNNFVNVEDKAKRQISVKIKLEADMDEERNLYFNNKRVEHNLPVQFKTNRYIIEGIVAQVLAKERWVEVQTRFTGVLPEIARLVKKGDTEKKSTGSTLAVLKDVISDEPTKIQTLIVQEQKFITISSPFQRDIMANLALLCEERDIGLFFKDYAIKVGNIIAFTTDLYSLSGTITNLEIK